MAEPSAIRRATGRGRDDWFAVLDEWGAGGRPFREVADWLTGVHGMNDWWAQKLIVEYEQERGFRQPGARPDGTFEVSASRTMPAPTPAVYLAVVDEGRRREWLGESMSLRTSRPNRGARFDWKDGETRVAVTFVAKGEEKTVVSVAHSRLPDAGRAASEKRAWKARLADLQAYLRR